MQALSSPGNLCILVVDDDPLIRDAIIRFIRPMGFNLLQAGNGSEALRLLDDPTTPPVGIVLTDIMMPYMSGIELLRDLRQNKPWIKVGIITGAATLDNSIAAINDGAYAYLLKPVFGEQVRDIVTKGVRQLEEQHFLQSNLDALKRRYALLETQLANGNEDMLTPEQNQVAGLIRGLRHELGNAFTAMKLNLSILETGELDSNLVREHLHDLSASVDEMMSLVSRLSQYPHHANNTQTVDLRDVLTTVADSMAGKLDTRIAQINTSIPPAEVNVFGSENDLVRVLAQIIENAAEANARRNGRFIDLTLETQPRIALITVTDEGPGFPPDSLDKLFSPHFTTKIQDGFMRGLGLGLFVAQATLNLYHGRIWAQNRPVCGASVYIELPLA